MPMIAVERFSGLDRRRLPQAASPQSLHECRNALLTAGAEIVSAPGVVHVGDLPSDSAGLYVLGSRLRCVRPRRGTIPPSAALIGDVLVDFDLLTGPATGSETVEVSVLYNNVVVTRTSGTWDPRVVGATFSLGGFSARIVAISSSVDIVLDAPWPNAPMTGIASVTNIVVDYPSGVDPVAVGYVATFGAAGDFGPFPYVTVRRSDNTIEHHWVRGGSSYPNSPTILPLGWQPSLVAVKHAGKIWTVDNVSGTVRFCSTLNGPVDWTTPGDAGFIPVITHSLGSREVAALSIYDDKLAVIFSDAVQLWAVDPDPNQIALVRVLGGTGTDAARSVVNVLGDLFYKTRRGFRALKTQALTGQIQEIDGLGSPIDDLVVGTGDGPAVWSATSGQYACALGHRIFVLRYSPATEVVGWSVLDAGMPVDYLADLDGVLYFRSGDGLYRFDPSTTAAWTIETQFIGGKTSLTRKRFEFIELIGSGNYEVSYITLDRNGTERVVTGPIISDTTTRHHIYIGILANQLKVRLTGSTPFRLSALSLTYKDITG